MRKPRVAVFALLSTCSIMLGCPPIELSPDKSILSFSFSVSVETVIQENEHTILVKVPAGTKVTTLAPTIVHTGAMVSPGSGEERNFWDPVTYTVTAEDSSVQHYAVTVVTIGIPTLSTVAPSDIETTRAIGGGKIRSDGGSAIIDRGICWGEQQNPTASGPRANAVEASRIFTAEMTGLQAGTLYYVRAFATNGTGTGYGTQVSFTSVPPPPAAPGASAVGGTAGSGKLSITWVAVKGATKYDLFFSEGESAPNSANGPRNLTTVSGTIEDLLDFTPYHVWVVAKNDSGSSSLSPERIGIPGIRLASVALDPSSVAIIPSVSVQVSASFLPQNATNQHFAWESSNSEIASLSSGNSSTAIVTGIAPGSATITATSEDGEISATCIVTVL
ncbi:MAG: Ig-like domain-containing protein [Spirochaetaceae bacterium]|nr:Ig-like domain-containing protein [Spirochaetaceae bacterium]